MEEKARARVAANKQLSKHERIIFYDWPNWWEHLAWIISAPIRDIMQWATEIEATEDEEYYQN